MPADELFVFETEAERRWAAVSDAVAAPQDAQDDAAADVAADPGADLTPGDAAEATDAEPTDATDAADVAEPQDAATDDVQVDAAPDGLAADGNEQDASPADTTPADTTTPDGAADDAVADGGDGDAPSPDAASDATDGAADAEVAADAPPTLDADAVVDAAPVEDIDVTDAAADVVSSADAVTADVGDDAALDVLDAAPTCAPEDCGDGNACTADACGPTGACQHTPIVASCDDGNVCTLGDVCGAGVCLAGAVTDCDDGNVCTADSCATMLGCSHTATTADCSDGDACTVADSCVAGACLAGAPLSCANDGNPCTADVCTAGACGHPALAVGSTCGPGATCDAASLCQPNDSVDMIALPAGSFAMGSPDGTAISNETPQHSVTLGAFELDKTEVTVAQYAAFYASLSAPQKCQGVNADAFSCGQPDTAGYCTWNVIGLAGQPVNCVDWYQASAYCAWAGKRLPTEAEWEYAARSGLAATWPWGEASIDCGLAVYDDGTGGGCATGGTSAPCSRPAGNTEQGACDMAGNLAEWCSDWFDAYAADAVTNPVGPISSASNARVLRGGSWSDTALALRTAARGSASPSTRNGVNGLRCARSL